MIYRLLILIAVALSALMTTSPAYALKMGPMMASSTTYAPSAPVSVSGTAGNGQVTVTWSAGTVDGTHSAATSYNLYRSTSSGAETLWQSGVTSPYVDTASNSTSYYYKVQAVNSAGSTLSAEVGPYTPTATVYAPNIPVIGTATAGNAQATVAFTASVVDGTHSAATSYTVTSSPGGFTATGSASPLTVTGLANDTAYTFTVTATNTAGTSAASAASNSVTPSGGSTTLIAGALNGTLATSTDNGVTWSQITTHPFSSTAYPFGISKIGSTRVIVSGGSAPILASSSDGTTWTQRTANNGVQELNGIANDGTTFIAVGGKYNGVNAILDKSTDGVTWTATVDPLSSKYEISGIAYKSGVWVAVGRGGRLIRSTDGTNWTQISTNVPAWTTGWLNNVAANADGSVWVIGGDNGGTLNLARSTDQGQSWTTVTSPWASGVAVKAIFHNGLSGASGLWLAGSYNGSIATSADGVTWTIRSASGSIFGSTGQVRAFTYANSTYVAVGDGGIIATSPDGTTWTKRTNHPFGTSGVLMVGVN